MTTDTETEVIRLPLWKNCVELMLQNIEHGATYPAEYFEEHLKESRDSLQFGFAISAVRTALLDHGYFLSGRGQDGNQYIILPPENHVAVMESYQRQAVVALKKGVILGANTRVDLLQDEERRKHEAVLERVSIRAALMSRRTPTLKKALTGLLK